MPELPEVETVRRTLEPRLVGKTITGVEAVTGHVIKQPKVEEFCRTMEGKAVVSLGRRGKYLLIEIEGGKTLVVHLRMTGQFTYTSVDAPRAKHTHVIFNLSDGHQLRYVDVRRFGEMHLVPTGEYSSIAGLAKMGPEPLGCDFTVEGLCHSLEGKKTKIKALLLDQSKVAGLGNIYVDEALFRAGVQPERAACTLTLEETGEVYRAVRQVLEEGIENRGTSIRDYVDGDGRSGTNQQKLQAYGRAGKACGRCGTTMEKTVVGQRTTVFCPHCQK